MSDREIDQQLVERVQRGDKAAFDPLVVKYQRKIFRLLSRPIRDAAEVEDVAQEAFIKAYRALPGFRGESAFYTWLYRIAINTTYLANKGFYDQIGKSVPMERGAPAATVRLISGCQDEQTSADGPFNGLFTGTLLKVWNGGAFQGEYARFHAEIVARMPRSQTPNHLVIGPRIPAFDRQRPFAIEG